MWGGGGGGAMKLCTTMHLQYPHNYPTHNYLKKRNENWWWHILLTREPFIICLIQQMYSDNSPCIKLKNKISIPFNVNIGVRQGCILSPTLFNIFISQFAEILNDEYAQSLQLDDHTLLSNIMWADDVVLLSKSKLGLQYQLDQLQKFSALNKLSVNIDKTKCVCFNCKGSLIRNCFKLGQTILEDVTSFKYLGVG